MKMYQVYVCEKCGKESKIQEDIALCEARHIGLSTAEEKHNYDALNFDVRDLSGVVNRTNNEQTRQAYDKAIERLLEFEKDHNMKLK